ncbi:MAG: polyisoprenoid-binding protein [Sphingobacteriales bacterium]|nr:MAG: polyisoprenoid-binding protein [Sphingobacteriales bacterium]
MATTKWNLDASHSEITFKVRHMMITSVTGSFHTFNANVETEEENFETAKIGFTADIDSISTKNEQRDQHLKSEDFFDAGNHPQLVFESTKLEKKLDEDYKLHGNLTIRGVSKPVVLDVEYGGTIKDPWGMTRAGFTVDGKINRKEFGLHWSAATETGGLVVSDEVKLHATIELTKA